MRGKAAAFDAVPLPPRITPAYAGKSHCHGEKGMRDEDHPRLCGEKQKKQPAAFLTIGSPPPMRGKDRDRLSKC